MGIRENIQSIRQEISAVSKSAGRARTTTGRAGRETEGITLLAVTKTVNIAEIEEAISCGISNIGESRVQEALIKHGRLNTRHPKLIWHLVGHLQKNKAKNAVKIFDLIHSLDSVGLAEEINSHARKINKIQDALIEVKTSGELSKFGIALDEALGAIKEIGVLKNIRIRGLMTIAPLSDDPEGSRPYFRMLRALRDKINYLTNNQLTILSMGMSDDFKVAIEEGATIIRIGRGIFKNADGHS